MNFILDLSEYIHTVTGVSTDSVRLTLLSIILIILIVFIKWFIKMVYSKLPATDRTKYMQNRKMQIVLTIICVVMLVLIWNSKLGGFITVISFVSAGFAIALKEVILNLFAGVYIRFSKPFYLEDRIEINELKGDVINMKALGFEVLEVGDRVNGEQSTGRIVHLPNSLVFTSPVKNYVKAFKYIWNEMKLEIDLDSDLQETKRILYEIVENNTELKSIPRKMEDAVDEVTLEYRIYFNNLEPIIYTSIANNHIDLDIRYLVHPKKARNVEDDVYRMILEEYKQGRIKLHKE